MSQEMESTYYPDLSKGYPTDQIGLYIPRAVCMEASANMALDMALMPESVSCGVAFLRHYQWKRPSVTFGYGQKLTNALAALPPGETPLDICRRPTGGGVVDHRDDWTYSLCFPIWTVAGKLRPVALYERLHRALLQALDAQQAGAMLASSADCAPSPSCFSAPVCHDLVNRIGQKIAGAAMRRTGHLRLVQGSVARDRLPGNLDYDRLLMDFAHGLDRFLQLEWDGETRDDVHPCEIADEEVFTSWKRRIDSAAWQEKR